MPARRKPTPTRTSAGFSTPVVETEEKVVITEELKVEEVVVIPEPEPEVIAEVEVSGEASAPAQPPTPPVFVDFAKKEPVKTPKVIKHPRNQPRFSAHK